MNVDGLSEEKNDSIIIVVHTGVTKYTCDGLILICTFN